MSYQQISDKQAEQIREGYRIHLDKWKIDEYDALKIAQEIFGKKGFASVQIRHTMDDPVDNQGYVIPTGEIWGYAVGYMRKGKRGASLSTRWISEDSYRDAFRKMYKHYKERNSKIFPKVQQVLYIWGIL